MLSASLSREWSKRRKPKYGKASGRHIFGASAVCTRLIGNALAVLNAIWVITFSTLQFTNLYQNCWCASSALQRGTGPGSWVAILASPADYFAAAHTSWISGTFLAMFCSAFCLFFFVWAKGTSSTKQLWQRKHGHATKVRFSINHLLRRSKEA